MLTKVQSKDYITVYTAKKDIEKGATLTKDMLEESSTPKTGALASLVFTEDPVGKYAQTDISAKDVITKSVIGDTLPFDQEYLYQIPENKQVISVTAGNFASGLSGYIQSGDIVRVYAYGGGTESAQPQELQYVRVLDVTYANGEKDGAISTVLFSVDEMQAEKLVEIENSARIHLSLINRFDTQKSEELLQKQEKILRDLAAQDRLVEQLAEKDKE